MTDPGTRPADADSRELAIAERERNVLIDAGAGTGKTTILVERLIHLVAPHDDGPALELDRIAAITFTRRAAGELRLRVRGRLIQALGSPTLTATRRGRLRTALSGVDTAYIGTIHSFADRLLRMRPSSAQIGPSYEVVDDREALVAETARVLLHGAARGTLGQRLPHGAIPPELLLEATETIVDALGVGLRPLRRETDFWIDHGLDSLVRGFVEHRDIDPPPPALWTPDPAALQRALGELVELGSTLHGDSPAAAWLRRVAHCADRIAPTDFDGLFADVVAEIHQRRRSSYKFNRRDGCSGDGEIWRRWNRIDRDGPSGPALGDEIVAPLHRWMATRLLRARPVVLALYEDVKQRHGVLDEIDLLLRLRNLMRDDLETRAFYQSRFDHVFVDEFQDTDPLQAEILLYLTEREARARDVDDVSPAPGRITIVGDPQQSIYRFRRADVATYSEVCDRLAADALRLQLTVNFRSVPSLVAWGNQRFRDVFRTGTNGARFDPTRGRVFHRDLVAGRTADRIAPVHVLPLASDDRCSAEEWRAVEACALPRYLRWLVENHETTVVDPVTGQQRRVAWGDICVLAMSTIHLRLLFAQLDELAIPYTASGSTLFLDDPQQRRFILAMRALSDPTDGPAAAALRRPPFFSADLGQLVAARSGIDPSGVAAAMDATILELRKARFHCSPGETARALLEKTCLGAAIAIGSNGAQRLDRLRELCHLADLIAFDESLDYDGVTAKMRGWIDAPETIDAPPPVRPRAVRVMTIHQAKGLEFPVVALWDARACAEIPAYPSAWQVTRDGAQWMIMLDGLRASQPAGRDLGAIERALLDEERRRLSYVAVTRARDLLVIPQAGDPNPKLLWRPLSDADAHASVHVADPYVVGLGAPWAESLRDAESPELVADTSLEADLSGAWHDALDRASRPSARQVAVTATAHTGAGKVSPSNEQVDRTAARERPGRHGPLFGTAVHRAIGIVLTGRRDIVHAAADCSASVGLPSQLLEALEADVRRGVATVRALGFATGPTMRLEYPIAGVGAEGELLVGAIDLLAVADEVLWVLDFKTDRPPASSAAAEFPAYAAQVKLYANLLARAGIRGSRGTRCALLFTGDGSLHEIEPLTLTSGAPSWT